MESTDSMILALQWFYIMYIFVAGKKLSLHVPETSRTARASLSSSHVADHPSAQSDFTGI